MRNAILLLLAGPLLFGCTGPGEQNTNGNTSGVADNRSGNSRPTIGGNPSPGIKIGDICRFEPGAVDGDSDALTFMPQDNPDWASFDSAMGVTNSRPPLPDVGICENVLIV